MTVNDDPFVWFYYIYGFTIVPPMVFLWIYHTLVPPAAALDAPSGSPGGGHLHPAGA